jgi:hypothetical protein
MPLAISHVQQLERRQKVCRTILVSLAVLLVAQGKVPAVTRRVPSEYPTIQSAIDDCNNGDVVIVAPEVYRGPGNRDIDFSGKAITVQSENGPEDCVIDCNGVEADPHRGFYFGSGEDANCVLAGFTITNGYASYGAGVYCEGDSGPTIINCIITGNSAEQAGGGIYCENASPSLTNCILTANYATSGGGMCNSDSSPTLEDCTFNGNRIWLDGCGGGICNWGKSDLTLTNCTVSDNSGGQWGGGMGNWKNSSATLVNCTFSGNSALIGGGICCMGGSNVVITNCAITGNEGDLGGGFFNNGNATLTNCVFIANSTPADGGGMCNGDSVSAILTNCTFYGNWAGNNGGGICPRGAILTNCIFWANTDKSGMSRAAQIYGGTPTVSYCCVQDTDPEDLNVYRGVGNIDDAPLFVGPGYWADANDPNVTVEPNDPNAVWVEGDYRLWWDSPCIDRGDNNSVPADTTDLDGKLRILDGNNDDKAVVDMGAYEYEFGFTGVDIYADDYNCINFKDFSVFAGNWLKYAGSNFALISDFNTTTVYLQGIAYDGNRVYITYGGAGTVNNVIEKREIDGTLVSSNDTAYDTTWELGGASIIDGQLYVAINGYRDHQGREWNRIGIYDTSSLDLLEVIEGNATRFTRDFLEGASQHNDYYWVIYDDRDTNPVVEQYDLDWNYVAEYPLRTDLKTPCHKYQGISCGGTD